MFKGACILICPFFTGGAWSKGRSHIIYRLLIGWTWHWPIADALNLPHTVRIKIWSLYSFTSIGWYLFLKALWYVHDSFYRCTFFIILNTPVNIDFLILSSCFRNILAWWLGELVGQSSTTSIHEWLHYKYSLSKWPSNFTTSWECTHIKGLRV